MTHVVILGAGIAGVSAAYALKAKLGPHDEVTVVSDKPYFHFVPSNPWIAMGWRERSDIAFPIGPYLESRGIRFIHSGVKRIQPGVIQVDLENGDVLFYDYLLVATGACALQGVAGVSDVVPGLAEYTQSVIHIDKEKKVYELEQRNAQSSLDDRQEELFRPIADRVHKIVEVYAKELNLAVVVNMTEDMVYANDVIDITTEIIRRVNADIVKNPAKPK